MSSRTPRAAKPTSRLPSLKGLYQKTKCAGEGRVVNSQPERPRKGAPSTAWNQYLVEVLCWLEAGRIPATIADFCRHAGVSRSTLRRNHPDIRERAYAYAQSSCKARSRPRPPGTESPFDRVQKETYRERDRLMAEVAKLKRDLVEEKRQHSRVRPVAERASESVRELRGAVDILIYELCRENPRRAAEVERMLSVVRQRSSEPYTLARPTSQGEALG
jgi:AcrR family transcriptional regulator